MVKASRRQLLRESKTLREELQKVNQMIFGVLIKLYKLDPEDDVFTKDQLKPEFLEMVKKAAKVEQ